MKVPLGVFGEAVMWRQKRHPGALNKYDSEWSNGIYLGVAGLSVEALIGTCNGVVRTNDFRRAPEEQWNKALLLAVPTSFSEYIAPSPTGPETFIIDAPVAPAPDMPEVPATDIQSRRLRLQKKDFERHGYTAGCGGCVYLQRNSEVSRNHSEACRKIMEECISNEVDGWLRKQRADDRWRDQLTRELEREDELL